MPLYLHGSLDCSCRAAAHLVTVTSWSVRDGAIRTVHELAVVVDHRLDLALTLKVADRQASLLLLARLGGRSRDGRLLRRHPVYDVVETKGAGRGPSASYCAKLGLGKYTRDLSAEL